MGNIVNEIKSVGIPCYGFYEGVPNCGELSPGDQAIVNSIVACEDKVFTSAEKDALWLLLNPAQQDNYEQERNEQVIELRVREYFKDENFKVLVGYLADDYDKKDWTDIVDAVELEFPLWSDT
jgi:hypothetical protein